MKVDRLLDRENPKTLFAQDARHWIALYREMIDFNEQLLDRVRGQLHRLTEGARADVMENDLGLIEDQLQRYKRRLEFWYGRQWDLEGLSVDTDSRIISYRDHTVRLTKREFQLLLLLVSRSPEYVTPRQLLVQAWRDSRLPEETLRTYIVRLRGRLAELGVGAEIVNRPRRGYAIIFKPQGEQDGPAPTA